MCLYSSLETPCSHAECSIVISIRNANRDVIRMYNEPMASTSNSEIHKAEPIEIVERDSPSLMIADQPAEAHAEPASQKEAIPENFAGALEEMRLQIDGLHKTQQLILGLLQQLVPSAAPK